MQHLHVRLTFDVSVKLPSGNIDDIGVFYFRTRACVYFKFDDNFIIKRERLIGIHDDRHASWLGPQNTDPDQPLSYIKFIQYHQITAFSKREREREREREKFGHLLCVVCGFF